MTSDEDLMAPIFIPFISYQAICTNREVVLNVKEETGGLQQALQMHSS